MKRGFTVRKVGRFRRSAGRGMARAGFPAVVIALVLGLKRETAQALVDGRNAPGALWSAAEMALFKEGRWMDLRSVIAELEGAAQQEAAGIAILETTHFEPELGLTAERCLAAAKRRAEGLAEAARLLRWISSPLTDPRAAERGAA